MLNIVIDESVKHLYPVVNEAIFQHAYPISIDRIINRRFGGWRDEDIPKGQVESLRIKLEQMQGQDGVFVTHGVTMNGLSGSGGIDLIRNGQIVERHILGMWVS